MAVLTENEGEVAAQQNASLTDKLDSVTPSKTSIEERLEKLPALIFEKELKLYELTVKLSETKKALETIESAIMRDINAETKEDGNKKYTNEASRTAELKLRLRDNSAHFELKRKEEDLHDVFEHQKVEHGFLCNMLSSAKYLAQLKIADAGIGVKK